MSNTQKHQHEAPIEHARDQLQNQHINDFLESLSNKDSPAAERKSLQKLLQKGIEQLSKVEAKALDEFFSEDLEEICPGCLVSTTYRVVGMRNIGQIFNDMLSSSEH